jgi:hypothetical protein
VRVSQYVLEITMPYSGLYPYAVVGEVAVTGAGPYAATGFVT